jgi:hypothetical protein
VTGLQDSHDRSIPSGDAWSAPVIEGAGGFDWGDAAIGAASGLGLALLLAGLALLAIAQRAKTRVATR